MRKDKNDIHKDIDDLFRDKLRDRSFDFQEEYWKDAEERITEFEQSDKSKNRKKGGWWLWVSGLCLLLTAGIIFNYTFSDNESASDQTVTQNTGIESENIETSETNNQTVYKPITDTVRSIPQSDTEHAMPELDNLIGLKEKPDSGKNTIRKGEITNTSDKKTIAKKSEKNTQSQNKTKNTFPDFLVVHETSENDSPVLPDDNDKDDSGHANDILNDTNTPLTDNNLKNTIHTGNDNTARNTDSLSPDVLFEGNANPWQDFIKPHNIILISGAEDSFKIKNTDSRFIPSDDPLSYGKKIHWYIGINYGFDYVTKSISEQGPSVPNQGSYITQKEQQESNLVTFGGGILGGVNIKRLNISTGIDLYKLGEKINYEIKTYVPETSYTIIYDSIGVVPIDSIAFVTSNEHTETKDSLNKYSYFEIPLLFGYTFGKGKIQFNLQTGPSIAFLKNISGFYLSSAGDLLASPQTFTVFRETNFNWLLTPSVTYQFSEKFKAQLQPWLKWNINSVVNKEESYTQRYTSYGMRLGILYQF
ncbi:MAG: hypothetical protein H7X71_08255 [Chitinophagales bacterium]|nr:hypothetical protein [Chitinophagales bacterium]